MLNDVHPKDCDDENDPVSQALRQTFSGPKDDLADPVRRRMDAALEGFRRDLESHPYARRLEGRPGPSRFGRPLRRLVGAHPLVWMTGAGALAGVVVALALVLGAGAPTWAEVSERFRSIPFLNATIYLKRTALDHPRQIELWVNDAGQCRMRVGSQVLFARDGQVTRTFDISTRQAGGGVDPIASRFLEYLSVSDQTRFSLDTIIAITSGRLVEVSPTLNADAVISEDMVVFDIHLDDTDAWVRVWALRESKLPCRLLVWDPSGAETMDVLFTYSRQPSQRFFDADVFEQALGDHALSDSDLAYACMQDPGGRPITARPFEASDPSNP